MTTHHDYLRDIVTAAEEVGAYIVALGPSERSGLLSVTLEWPRGYLRVTVEDVAPAQAIRKLEVLR